SNDFCAFHRAAAPRAAIVVSLAVLTHAPVFRGRAAREVAAEALPSFGEPCAQWPTRSTSWSRFMSARHRRRTTSAPVSARRHVAARPSQDSAAAELDRLLDEALARPAPAVASFAELGVPAELVRGLPRRGITAPFAIQT